MNIMWHNTVGLQCSEIRDYCISFDPGFTTLSFSDNQKKVTIKKTSAEKDNLSQSQSKNEVQKIH